MKRKITYLCLLILLVSSLTASYSFAQSSSEEGVSFSRKMVLFIRKLLDDNPKPVQEDLVRDEL
ncbi:MAG: hypothetical protein ABII18_11235 [bacterium]|nr:hypothetical protein [bacterium]MBU1918780.1 hypothetical protein [bacterium]